MTDERTPTTDESSDGNTHGATRRGVLAAGVAGLGLTGIGAGSASATSGGNPPWAPDEHDHSGEYGTSTTLGQNTPVEAIDVTDLSAATVNQRYEVTTDDDLVETFQDVESGDAVVLSPGVHEVDETLTVPPNVTLRGQGFTVTKLVRTGDFPLLEYPGTKQNRIKLGNIQALAMENAPSGGGYVSTSTDLVRATFTDGIRLTNVRFGGFGSTGNNLFVEGCWDWRLYGTQFAAGGDPEVGNADLYALNDGRVSTNNFLFVNCRWEKVSSNALYSDNSEGQTANGRFLLTNCKFHSRDRKRPERRPDVYHIDGGWSNLLVSNSRFIWSNLGFIRNELQVTNVSNCSFQRFALDSDAPALSLNYNGASIVGNQFFGGSGEIIEATDCTQSVFYGNYGNNTGGITVTGDSNRVVVAQNVLNNAGFGSDPLVDGVTVDSGGVTVVNNYVNNAVGSGIVANASDVHIESNRVHGATGDGIRVENAGGGAVNGNVIVSPGGAGVTSTESDYLAVTGNFVQGGGVTLSGTNNGTAANVTK